MVLGTTLASCSFARSKPRARPSAGHHSVAVPIAISVIAWRWMFDSQYSVINGRWSTSAWSALSTSRTGWEIRTLRCGRLQRSMSGGGCHFGHHHHGRLTSIPPELLEPRGGWRQFPAALADGHRPDHCTDFVHLVLFSLCSL